MAVTQSGDTPKKMGLMLHLINGQIQIRPKEITGVASQTVTPIQVKKVLENQKNKK